MTRARAADVPASLNVEFGCARHCQAELDLDGMPIRLTLGQMLTKAHAAHSEAHKIQPPQRVYLHDESVLVRSAVDASAEPGIKEKEEVTD